MQKDLQAPASMRWFPNWLRPEPSARRRGGLSYYQVSMGDDSMKSSNAPRPLTESKENNVNKLKFMSGLIGAACLAGAMTAAADTVRVYGGTLQVSPSSYVKNMTLTVTGPNGFNAQDFSKNSAPRVSLVQNGQLADGLYSWNMTASTNEPLPQSASQLDDGRGNAQRPQLFKSTSMSGSFEIRGGTLVQPDATIKE